MQLKTMKKGVERVYWFEHKTKYQKQEKRVFELLLYGMTEDLASQ